MAEAGLRVAIDGRELFGRTTGVGRNLVEILRCWASHPRHWFTIVVPADPTADLRAIGPRFQWVVDPAPVAGTWWEQLSLPRQLRRIRPDVLFAPAYTAPLLSPCPVVLTVHDLSFFAHPEWFARREGVRRRWLTRASARKARTVVTVSEFSASEIERYLGVPKSKILVAPNGPPIVSKMTPGVAVTSKTTPEVVKRLVLFVGSLFNRRRLPDMIVAFAEATRDIPDARLVLIGDNRTSPPLDPRALAAATGAARRIEWLEYVDEATLNRMYDAARVFLFLSDYEGFAITPLEAIAHGVPPVLLDTPVSREVYGDAARLVPADRGAIAAALRDLLTDDRSHAALAAAGQARLSQFSWQRSADLILNAIEQAAR